MSAKSRCARHSMAWCAGLIMNGREVPQGLKIGDVDPRLVTDHCYTISDKARALGGSVLEAILMWKSGAPGVC